MFNGEEACAMGEPNASATVRASDDCSAFYIEREQFVDLIYQIPGLQRKVFQMVVDRAKYERSLAKREKESLRRHP